MSPRGPGRPAGSAGSAGGTRERIVAAAREQLAANGFAGTSLRAVARQAGVDPSLISHYFGDKAGLLVATLQLPFNPVEKITAALHGSPDSMGVRLVTAFLAAWDPHSDTLSALLRSSFGPGAPAATPAVQVAQNVIVTALSARMSGPDTATRATLAAAQLIGMATFRYVARLEPVASAPAVQVARWYGPALQSLLTPGGEAP